MSIIDSDKKFDLIKNRLMESIKRVFPVDGKAHELRLKRVWADDNLAPDDYGSQKKARLNARTWSVPVYADIDLIDKETKKVIDSERKMKVASLPKMTDRGSFIVGGNEYQVQNVLRLRPGAYTRIQENGNLESQVNLAKGKNFKIFLDPKTGIFTMRVGTSNLRLYPLMIGLGLDRGAISAVWGPDLTAKNAKSAYDEELQKAHKAFFGKVAPSTAEAIANVAGYFDGNTEISKETTAKTLGKAFDKVSADMLLATSAKILAVTRGDKEPDERDAMEFKSIHDIEDMLSERIDKQSKRLEWNIKRNLDRKNEVKGIVSNATFGSHVDTFFTGSDEYSTISSVTNQTNPLSMIGEANKITLLGPGGISNTESVTMDTRNVHPTSFGFIDPIHSPECFDEETEVFTSSGWKPWSDITPRDELAIMIDGQMDFSVPDRLIAEHYAGPMYGLKTAYMNYLVTPNHRVYCSVHDAKCKINFKFMAAEDVHRKPRRFMCGGHGGYAGRYNASTFSLPKIEKGGNAQKEFGPIDIGDWAEFMGWYLSEGSCYHKDNLDRGVPQSYIAKITQTKPSKEKIRRLLEKMPFSFSYSDKGGDFSISGKQLTSYLKRFGLSPDKYIPEEFFHYQPEVRRRLMQTLVDGDGKVDKHGCVCFHSTSKRLAEGFQRLAISLGYSTQIGFEPDHREERYLGCYRIQIHKHDQRVSLKNSVKGDKYRGFYIQDYSGMVYCATVPGGLLYVRRDGGHAHWSGNSAKIGTTVHMPAAAIKDGTDIKTTLIDRRTGKRVLKTPSETTASVVAFADGYNKKGSKYVAKGRKVKAINKGKLDEVLASEVDYIFPTAKGLFDISTNLVPFLQSNQGNRAMMASKMLEQALPLRDREAPLVQVKATDKYSFEDVVGQGFSTRAPTSGTVTKVTKEAIHLKGSDGKSQKIGIYDRFPLNTHVYMQSYAKVKPGDKVKEGQLLADSNYTANGTLAIGTNLNTAYAAYKGMNYEDGVVISDMAADKLTSLHKHEYAVNVDDQTVLNKKKFQAYYPGVIDVEAADKLDSDGVIKVGQKVSYGDIVIAALKEEAASHEAEQLRKLHKGLAKPYRNVSKAWKDEDTGVVVDVVRRPGKVTVYINTEEKAKVGDKLVGRYGNKGTITRIIPNAEMPRDAEDKPLDIILNPIGIPSRINVGQMLETAAGKMAAKTGKKYVTDNFSGENYLDDIKSKMKKLGLSDVEPIFDPILNKKLPPVFVGKQYILKLDHSTRKKFSARSSGSYTADMSPSRGGGEGGLAIGKMESAALMAAGAKHNLREMATVKCFVRRQMVDTDQGPVDIAQIVNKRMGVKVLTQASDGSLHYGEITNYWKRRIDEALVTVRVMAASSDGRFLAKKIICTGTHKFFLEDGSKCPASDLSGKRLQARALLPNEVQFSMVVGSLLGDGCLTRGSRSFPAYSECHGSKQKGYLEFKASVLGCFARSGVSGPYTNSGYGEGKPYYRWNTLAQPWMEGLYDEFYVGGRKHITEKIASWLTPLSLAIWYCDDGSCTHIKGRNKSYITRLHTIGLSDEDRAILVDCLSDRYGLSFSVTGDGSLILYGQSKKFHDIVAPYMHESFAYKAPMTDPGAIGTFWRDSEDDVGSPVIGTCGVPVLSVSPHAPTYNDGKFLYNIEVENDHRYFVAGILVANSEKNDEFWRALHTGRPLPAPRQTFATEKLEAMIKGSGIDILKDGTSLQLAPMTDKHIKEVSNGEIKDALALRGKDLKPEKGGIFDPVVTGGLEGKHWNHVSLAEPMPSPAFETPIRELLSLTKADYDAYVSGKKWVDKSGKPVEPKTKDAVTSGKALQVMLSNIDMESMIRDLKARIPRLKGSELNKANRKLRYLLALKKNGEDPSVYVVKSFPVLPAVYRPIYAMPDGNLTVSEVNDFYRDAILVNNQLKDKKIPDGLKADLRRDLYEGLKGIAGLGGSLAGRPRKGLIEQIAGDRPKTGYFQSKIMSRRQDYSGRSTIVPEPSLGLDEAMIPEKMAWKMYAPFVIRELVTMGYTPLAAKDELESQGEAAKKALELVMKDRPVFLNRAPSLHKFSFMSFMPKITDGKAIKINPLVVEGYNADFDGDQILDTVLAAFSSRAILTISEMFGSQFLEERRMTSRYKEVVPTLDDNGDVYCLDLEDFPHGELISATVGKNGPIEWYHSIPGTKVLSYDEDAGQVGWKEVSGWSIHFDREIEVVNLHTGRQIITDDDPRAVYGVSKDTLTMHRATPSDALASGMLVPRNPRIDVSHTLDEIDVDNVSAHNSSALVYDSWGLDSDCGYYFGAVCGDGWVSEAKNVIKGICLAGITSEIQEKFERCLSTLFPDERPSSYMIRSKDSYGESIKCTYSSVNLGSATEPFVGRGARKKHLPPFYMSAPLEFRRGLFAGLMDTDGTINVVKAEAKNKPQLQASYSTASIRLAREVKLLASSIGICGRITASKTPAGKDFWCVSFSNVDMQKWGGAYMAHPGKVENLLRFEAIADSPALAKSDIVPMPSSFGSSVRKAIGSPRNATKDHRSIYATVSKSLGTGRITRFAAERVASFVGRDVIAGIDEGAAWLSIVDNRDVTWDQVVSVEKTGIRETGYDLTVPGYETFMNADGVILSNTMAVHTPITEPARKEAHRMLPSANLFSVQDGTLMNKPRHEQLLGLFLLTRSGGKSKMSFPSVSKALAAYRRGKAKLSDSVTVAGKRTTIGRAIVNNVLPTEYRDNSLVFTKKTMEEKFRKMAKEKPLVYARVVGELKDLGNAFAYEEGFTIGLKDLEINAKGRDKIFSDADKRAKSVGTVRAYTEATKKLDSWLEKELGERQNSFFTMWKSGAKGNSAQVRQIVAAPVLVKDIHDKAVPYPIKHSYAEGLGISEYLSAMAGARKGMVDRALMTAEPGAFAKEYVASAINERITMNDCGTHEGIVKSVNDPDAADRYLAKAAGGFKRNTLVTPAVLSKLRGRVPNVTVRSPSTCKAPDGICQMCYGLDENGDIINSGSNVGVLAAQAITAPLTQMSLDAKERCIVKVDDDVRIVEIGEFIDDVISSAKTVDVQGPHEIVDMPSNYQVPAFDKVTGKLSWRPLGSVIRHKADCDLLKISVRSGRNITATPYHSFVTLRDCKPTKAAGSDLRIGDRMPSALNLEEPNPCASVEVDAYVSGKTIRRARRHIPGEIALDWDFGWIIGAYIAEGNSAKYYTSFTNADNSFCDRVKAFADSLNLTWNEYCKDETRECMLDGKDMGGYPSRSVRINGSVLSEFFKVSCGRVSHEKRIPDFAMGAPDDFILGLFSGFLDGDGSIGESRRSVRLCSSSKQLLEGFRCLASRVGMFLSGDFDSGIASFMYKHAHKLSLVVPERKKRAEELAKVAAENMGREEIDAINNFGDRLVRISEMLSLPKRSIYSATKRGNLGREALGRHINRFEEASKVSGVNVDGELADLKVLYDSDVVWDKIVSIEEVSPSTPYVYDFSVPGPETFVTYCGIVTCNTMRTFHTGSVMQTKKDPSQGLRGGFERVKEILEMPHHLRGKATLAEVDGKVAGIKRSSAGGWVLTVGGREHFIEPGRYPVVKNGQDVKRGDRLSDGNIKPQELLQLKGTGAVSDYLVSALDSEYKSQGINVKKKIFETAIRPLVNNAQILESGKSKHIAGDFASISAIKSFNEGKDKDDQIKYEPMVKGVNTFPLQSKDWLHRLNYIRLKDSLTQGAAEGWKSDIMKSPVGSYAYGIFYGKDQEKRGAELGLPSYDSLFEEDTDELEEFCE